ncbi:VOC family protein [Actinotalea solisilvae]|uniref:VOC family protein n=1 Tax=Actinotalea solisilvae TaxID=2072922 RepID=UPI0018F18940|nr:VOC family protein [Actinotalea solisilvae]
MTLDQTTAVPAAAPAATTPSAATTAAPANGAVAWFEIGSTDPASAQEFYGSLFGWTFAAEDVGIPYYEVATGAEGSLGGGIADTSAQGVAYATVCVQVADVAATLAAVPGLGGEIVAGPIPLSTGMVIGYLRDREGSVVGLFTPPSGA